MRASHPLLGAATELHPAQLGDDEVQTRDLGLLGCHQCLEYRLVIGKGVVASMRGVRDGTGREQPPSFPNLRLRTPAARCVPADASRCLRAASTVAPRSDAPPFGRLRPDEAPRSRRLANRHSPSPLHHSSLSRSPRRPRNKKTWPQNGLCASASCTIAARPFMPRRISVTGHQPDAGAGRHADHVRSARQSSTVRSASRLICPNTRTVAAPITISSEAAGWAPAAADGRSSLGDTHITGNSFAVAPRRCAKLASLAGRGSPNHPDSYCRRHLNSRFALTPCSRASLATEVPARRPSQQDRA